MRKVVVKAAVVQSSGTPLYISGTRYQPLFDPIPTDDIFIAGPH